MSKLDTTHLRHLVLFLASLGGTIAADEADGKISVGEMFAFVPLLGKIGEITADIKSVPAELADLDQVEAHQLIAFLEDNLKGLLPFGSRTEDVAEACLQAAGPLMNVINAYRGIAPPKAEAMPGHNISEQPLKQPSGH